MNPSKEEDARRAFDWSNNVVAPLIVGAILGTAPAIGWYWEHVRAQKRIDAAPRRYVEELDKLITRAAKEGPENAVLNARAIVAARNSLRNSLVGISSQLDSEIDHLAADIGEVIKQPQGPSMPQPGAPSDAKQAYDTIQVLVRIWPSKKQQIEVEIRKLLAELGLEVKKTEEKSTDDAGQRLPLEVAAVVALALAVYLYITREILRRRIDVKPVSKAMLRDDMEE